jgi:hypothetical protein
VAVYWSVQMTRLSNVAVGAKVTATIENADRTGVNKTSQLMTPTSVSTGSIGTYGAVTFSAAAAVSLNGCFTSEFDWYDVIFDVTCTAAGSLTAVLRLAGTDASTAYDRQENTGISATATEAQTLNATTFRLTGTNIIGRHSGTVRLFNPALAVATTGTVISGGTANPMTAAAGSRFSSFIQHRTLTAYDGLTVSVGSGTITGSIRVYGII